MAIPPACPTLSLIVPVHNAARWVGSALRSALAQAFEDMEIIVVDDGSVDASCTEVKTLLADSRVRLIGQRNRGVSVARNRGLSMARGRYVCFLDADDLLAPGIFAAIVPMLEANAALDFVLFDFFEFKGDGDSPSDVFAQSLPARRPTAVPKRMTHPLRDYLKPIGNQIVAAVWNVCFRRDVLSGLLFRRGVELGEDSEFLFRFLVRARCGLYLPRVGYFYRFVGDSASRTLGKDFFLKRLRVFSLFAETFRDDPRALRLIQRRFTNRIVKSCWKMVHAFATRDPAMESACETFLETLFVERQLRLFDFTPRWQVRFLPAWWRAHRGRRGGPHVLPPRTPERMGPCSQS